MSNKRTTWQNKLIKLFFAICITAILFVILQIFFVASFSIPSDSMEPALKKGDNIIVNKLIMGPRVFNIKAALNKEDITIKRLPGTSRLKRNDIAVFNFPYPENKWDSINFNIMLYYVKRCIALPGDTLSIQEGFFKITGLNKDLGNTDAQKRISLLTHSNNSEVVYESYPWDETITWTIRDFGPLIIPAKGHLMEMNYTNFVLYYPLISWEQKIKPLIIDDIVYLGDSVIRTYQFKENYYFMAGDKLENSQDSRYWGLIPESYIVGKASFIWKSKDPRTGKIRWDRTFRKI